MACKQPILSPGSRDPDKCEYQYLSTNGDGTGTVNANGDYSSASGFFFWEPAAGETIALERIMIYIEDSGSVTATKYGATTGLTTGVSVYIEDGSAAVGSGVKKLDMTPMPIKTNGQWQRQCYDFREFVFSGGGNKVLSGRWTFRKDAGVAVQIVGSATGADVRRLVVQVDDDLTGLIAHDFFARGYREVG